MRRYALHISSVWIVCLMLFGVGQIVHRTPPVRTDSFFFDFSNVYSASRVWLAGKNPYDIQLVYRAWNASDHGPYLGSSIPGNMARWAAVYPPSSLLLIAPFAALPAVWGHLLWAGASVGLAIAAAMGLISLGGLGDIRSRLLFVACAFASAPFQCALEAGQPALPACALVILAVWAFAGGRLTLAGILLGLATAFKVQIGAPFIVYYLFIRQWRVGMLATILLAVATLVAVGRMEALGITSWWADWQRNMAATLQAGAINDPRPGGPFRNDIVNLQTIFDVFVHRQFWVDTMVLLVFLPLLAAIVANVRRDREAGTNLLALSLVAALSMLPVYRRLYDGLTLLMLLAWAIAALKTARPGMAWLLLAILCEFLLPVDLIPFVLRRTHMFDGIVSSTFWQAFVVPHHAWGLLILTIGTALVFTRAGRRNPAAALQSESGMRGLRVSVPSV
jgi:hypothetical protein